MIHTLKMLLLIVQTVINQLREEGEDITIFVVAFDHKNNHAHYLGYGCPKCLYNDIQKMNDRGDFQHTERRKEWSEKGTVH